MPFSTPVTAESVAMPMASTTRPIWTGRPTESPKTTSSPTLRLTTPMPSEVATPKMVPRIAAVSAAVPMGPLMRLPKIG